MEELPKTPSKRYELRSFLDVLAGHRRNNGGPNFSDSFVLLHESDLGSRILN